MHSPHPPHRASHMHIGTFSVTCRHTHKRCSEPGPLAMAGMWPVPSRREPMPFLGQVCPSGLLSSCSAQHFCFRLSPGKSACCIVSVVNAHPPPLRWYEETVQGTADWRPGELGLGHFSAAVCTPCPLGPAPHWFWPGGSLCSVLLGGGAAAPSRLASPPQLHPPHQHC